jgi:hypothetical protein
MKFRGSHSKDLILNSEFETKLYWFRVKNNPTMAKFTGQEYKIMSFHPSQMNGFKKNKEKYNIDWWRLAEFPEEPILLHSPEFIKDVNILKID